MKMGHFLRMLWQVVQGLQSFYALLAQLALKRGAFLPVRIKTLENPVT
jgi:hypothetical protein